VALEIGNKIDILKLLRQAYICWQVQYNICFHSSSSAIILGWVFSRNLNLLKSIWINVHYFTYISVDLCFGCVDPRYI
jgi:hypothetical protein